MGVIFVALFSVMTPIGIMIGWILLDFAQILVEVIFQALACGTFLYIGASEVIVSEFSGQ